MPRDRIKLLSAVSEANDSEDVSVEAVEGEEIFFFGNDVTGPAH